MRNANSGVRNANFSGFNPAPLRGGGGGGGGGGEGGTCSNNKTLQWHFSCFSRLLNSVSILAPTLFDKEIVEEDT